MITAAEAHEAVKLGKLIKPLEDRDYNLNKVFNWIIDHINHGWLGGQFDPTILSLPYVKSKLHDLGYSIDRNGCIYWLYQ